MKSAALAAGRQGVVWCGTMHEPYAGGGDPGLWHPVCQLTTIASPLVPYSFRRSASSWIIVAIDRIDVSNTHRIPCVAMESACGSFRRRALPPFICPQPPSALDAYFDALIHSCARHAARLFLLLRDRVARLEPYAVALTCRCTLSAAA